MKKKMMETALHICGMSKGTCRHKKTWWWNEEAAQAAREKRIKYGKWKTENSTEARSKRRVNEMQTGLFSQQRKRNRRNAQVI